MNLGNDKAEEKSALEQYGVDLTSKAREGKLDPVIGRDSVRRFSIPMVGPLRHVLLYLNLNVIQGSSYCFGLATLTPEYEPAYSTPHPNSFSKNQK